MAYSEDQNFDELLDAITQAMLAEQDDVDYILERYAVQGGQVKGLITLVHGLRNLLYAQDPSEKFVKDLKKDLLGQSKGVGARLRAMPARVQLAAGVAAVLAGFMLITRRRLFNLSHDNKEVPALQ